VSLAKSLKIDYDLLREIQGRTFTLGDIMALCVALSDFGQFIAAFQTLLEEPFLDRISRAVDRWKWRLGVVPIIPDGSNGLRADVVIGGSLSRLL
jgi:hypothetical protein